ncbi:hypothetical protein SteCoe_4765 [Stentor coeruleus]|uniref:Uncharacterized protein n=1 Tax=Stentor coeruleus TaxID=5963 RepID=A0A1R2CTV3_9CILI|nr:hypothetical protein SteCoe_4765 [Stentor coeruleus]
MGKWEESLFSCCASGGFCLIVALFPICYPFLQGWVVSKAVHQSFISACICPLFCCCIGAAVNRGKIRDRYLIEGSFCEDCLIHCFCSPCALCQEYSEVRNKERL